jgi:hypothetical protein
MKPPDTKAGSAVLVVLLMLGGLFADVTSCMAEPQWQAGGAVGLLSAKQGSSDPSVPSHLIPGLGGTTFSADLSLDRIVTSRISVGTELTGGADIKGRQSELTARSFGTLNGRHSDTVLVGTVKVNIFTMAVPNGRPGAGLELIGVAGAGPAWRHTEREGLVQELHGGTRMGVSEAFSKVVFAGVVGLDAAASISPKAALLVTAQYNILADDDRDSTGLVQTGAGSRIFRFGLGVRFRF